MDIYMKYKLNVSVDDVSPHPASSIDLILPKCKELLALFPAVRFTFFVPIAYHRTVNNAQIPVININGQDCIYNAPLQIDLFNDFCNC
mgnify:CR=1 FL=1